MTNKQQLLQNCCDDMSNSIAYTEFINFQGCVDDMGNIINYTGFMNCLNAREQELEKQLQSYSNDAGSIKSSAMRYNIDSIFNQLEIIRQLKKCTHSIKPEPVASRENIEKKPKRCFILNILKRVKQKLR